MKNPFKKNKLNDSKLQVAYATGFITPKKIILDAIKTRLNRSGCIKMILSFPIDEDNYTIMLKNETGETTNVNLDKSDISLIKKIFISRIVSSWNEKNPDIEPKRIQVLINIIDESIDAFITDYKEKVYKFDF